MKHWPITLHEAIRIVLADRPDRAADTRFISEQINARRLYVQRDGGAVFPEQVFLRARNYPQLFQLQGRTVVKMIERFARQQAAARAPQARPASPKDPVLRPRKQRYKARVTRLQNKAREEALREAQLKEAKREARKLGASAWRPKTHHATMPEEI